MAIVEKWTQEMMDEYRKEFPKSEPKQYAVRESPHSKIIWGFHAFEADAKQEADQIDFDDKLGDEFDEWIDTIMAKYPDAELEHIYEVITSRCH